LNSQNISHWHNDCEVVYVNQGTIDIIVEGNLYTLKEHDSIFIGGQKVHNMHAQKESTIVSIIIFNQEIYNNIASSIELEQPILHSDYHLEKIYDYLYYELTSKPSFYEQNTIFIIQNLLINILRNEPTIKVKNDKKINANLLKLFDEINSSYRYITFTDASNIMNMNPSYFSRFFHNFTGISFVKYLNCVRVEKAIEYLHNNPDLTMVEIADLCGFQTIRNFNRIIKDYTGYSPTNIPSDYRFNGLNMYKSSEIKNPTLNCCKLIEFSSPHN
ncbi:MAG: helix-turn-helix domain-containing protein, partial [Bacilli bacterium]